MGHKVHPKAFRLGVSAPWDARWFAKGRAMSALLRQDVEIRRFLRDRCKEAGLSRVEIERTANSVNITISTAKPGLIIGRGGSGVEELKKTLEGKYLKKSGQRLNVSIKEVEHPSADAQVVATNVALDLEKRIPFRRTMRRALEQIIKTGVPGAKITLSGRLDGTEIARVETLLKGKVPLHTLRSNISFGRATAVATYGTVGVKVWVNHGEVFDVDESQKSKVQSQNVGVTS